jgi:hypothetical protein
MPIKNTGAIPKKPPNNSIYVNPGIKKNPGIRPKIKGKATKVRLQNDDKYHHFNDYGYNSEAFDLIPGDISIPYDSETEDYNRAKVLDLNYPVISDKIQSPAHGSPRGDNGDISSKMRGLEIQPSRRAPSQQRQGGRSHTKTKKCTYVIYNNSERKVYTDDNKKKYIKYKQNNVYLSTIKGKYKIIHRNN